MSLKTVLLIVQVSGPLRTASGAVSVQAATGIHHVLHVLNSGQKQAQLQGHPHRDNPCKVRAGCLLFLGSKKLLTPAMGRDLCSSFCGL